MAEIDIEKKKPIWPWIILVLVILAILYFLVFADDENDTVDDMNTETEQLEVDDEPILEDGEEDPIFEEDTTDTISWNSPTIPSTAFYQDYA